MAAFKTWTKSEDAALATAFGGQQALDSHVAERARSFMGFLATGQVVAMVPHENVMERASSATGRTRLQVLDRLVWLSRTTLGMNIAEPARARRRDVLRQYALAGLRTLDEIQAADKGGQLTVPGIDAPKAAAPAPKPRTLDDIASELRMAREDAVRLAIAFVEAGRAAAHAEKRMDELRAELTRAVEEV